MVDERRQQLRLEGSIPGQLTSATIATSTVYGEQSLQWRSQIERAGRCTFFSQRVYIVLTATRGLDLPRFGGRVAGLGSGYLI